MSGHLKRLTASDVADSSRSFKAVTQCHAINALYLPMPLPIAKPISTDVMIEVITIKVVKSLITEVKSLKSKEVEDSNVTNIFKPTLTS